MSVLWLVDNNSSGQNDFYVSVSLVCDSFFLVNEGKTMIQIYFWQQEAIFYAFMTFFTDFLLMFALNDQQRSEKLREKYNNKAW